MSDFTYSGKRKLVGKKQARARARGLLSQYHNTQNEYVDVYGIAKQLKLSVIEHDLPVDQSGLLVVNEAGKAVIVANKKHSETRRRFTVAHELGHYLLHYERKSEVFHRDLRSGMGTNRQEIESNAFAAELLMPSDELEAWASTVEIDIFEDATNAIAEKATQLRVSVQALTIRLEQLNLYSGEM